MEINTELMGASSNGPGPSTHWSVAFRNTDSIYAAVALCAYRDWEI